MFPVHLFWEAKSGTLDKNTRLPTVLAVPTLELAAHEDCLPVDDGNVS